MEKFKLHIDKIYKSKRTLVLQKPKIQEISKKIYKRKKYNFLKDTSI